MQEIYDLEQLDEREAYYVRSFDTYYNGYNATDDGQGIPGRGYSEPDDGDVNQSPRDDRQESEYSYKDTMFVDLFDGRYFLSNFTRIAENGIVRIKFKDEVWCYKSDSKYHAELLVRWFASSRNGYSGKKFDWVVEDNY